MKLAELVLLAVCGCYVTTRATASEEPCPSGPFETDAAAISNALAVRSAQPSPPEGAPGSPNTTASERFTEGVVWTGAGGFMSDPVSKAWLYYDAKRYQSVSGSSEPGQAAEIAKQYDLDRAGSGLVIRQVAVGVTYITLTAQPTAQQARQIACLANQLFTTSPAKKELAKNPDARPRRHAPAEVTVTGYKRCGQNFTDGHQESFELVTSAPGFRVGGLDCPQRQALEDRLKEAIYAPVKEVMARATH